MLGGSAGCTPPQRARVAVELMRGLVVCRRERPALHPTRRRSKLIRKIRLTVSNGPCCARSSGGLPKLGLLERRGSTRVKRLCYQLVVLPPAHLFDVAFFAQSDAVTRVFWDPQKGAEVCMAYFLEREQRVEVEGEIVDG